jgi:hypothetical protein
VGGLNTNGRRIGETMLDIAMLKKMPPRTKFAVDKVGDYLYVAVRGDICDWTIYKGLASKMGIDDVASFGDKVCDEKMINQLVPCDADSFRRYRY